MNVWDFNNNQNGGFGQVGINNQYTTASDILDEIMEYIYAMLQDNAPGMFLLNKLNEMERQGLITIVGHGTNRKVLKINADMAPVLNRLGFLNTSTPVVVKVPFNIVTGSKDNYREAYTYQVINQIAHREGRGSDAFNLTALLPEAYLYDDKDGFLIVQEEVVPIEKSEQVASLVQVNSKGIYTQETIGSAVLHMIQESPNLMQQMAALMDVMDRYFIIGDLNVLYSRFNFGFKNINGKYYLTVLDLGYVLPRINGVEPVCPICKHKQHYVHIGSKLYNDSEDRKMRLRGRLVMEGLYSCCNDNCGYSGQGSINDPFTEGDMKVFERYVDTLRSNMNNINDQFLLRCL